LGRLDLSRFLLLGRCVGEEDRPAKLGAGAELLGGGLGGGLLLTVVNTHQTVNITCINE
jgi:hypothetical protein